ncbi:hypothetical protein NOGI109294_13565 [Nocardiopsis gilva]|uniref:hypothetical protein n=1 Tax=Nocardiopsis gilva TaxID=280236 RepID=UPI000349CF44|nr:hypothetical protein [Nocardiopsis gilva]
MNALEMHGRHTLVPDVAELFDFPFVPFRATPTIRGEDVTATRREGRRRCW